MFPSFLSWVGITDMSGSANLLADNPTTLKYRSCTYVDNEMTYMYYTVLQITYFNSGAVTDG